MMVQILGLPMTVLTGIFCHCKVFILDFGLGTLICGKEGREFSCENFPGGGGGGGGPLPNPGGGGGGGGGTADILGLTL